MTRDDRLGPDAVPFSLFLQQLFSARRKTIRKGLTQFGYAADDALAKLSIDPQHRVEVVPPGVLLALFRATRL
jgi:16S rRNA A1518/A1519 N6-dimethyltransferase RsmA/KsgA/DIM1 with predicted DNA glycosylase/AP lyase activity